MPPKSKRAKNASSNSTLSSAPVKRRDIKLAEDADSVLAKCRSLREEIKKKSKSRNQGIRQLSTDDDNSSALSSTLKVDETSESATGSLQGRSIIEVSEMSTIEVVEAIELSAIQIANQVLRKQGFSLEVPSRTSANQIYVPELDRIVLGEKRGTRSFLNVKVRIHPSNPGKRVLSNDGIALRKCANDNVIL